MGSLYGFEVKSDLALRRLNSAAGTRGELVVETTVEPLVAPAGGPVGSLVGADGRRWFASYELGNGSCLLQMPPTGSFLLEPGAGRVAVESSDEDAELLEHRIASSAICTLLSLRGDLALHAAAVEADGRAIVFCGPSLRGKSTLARALGESGCPLLGEDGIAIELSAAGPIAHPGARGVRMRSSGGGRQRPVLVDVPGAGEPGPCPLAAVVLLGERRAEFAVEPLAPARALALLTPNLIHSGGRASIGAAFQRLAALLGSVPALKISLPDDLEALPETCERFLDAMPIRG
ncbi:MAG TPA: hypothetical protein VFS48_07200 [Solirubrobacterales bacterium]|nr:hypothetical protein [Solirubrobacterales bacterium]